jgi:predicted RNA binding protein YcfA (HicA-like mRNA interferase family)
MANILQETNQMLRRKNIHHKEDEVIIRAIEISQGQYQDLCEEYNSFINKLEITISSKEIVDFRDFFNEYVTLSEKISKVRDPEQSLGLLMDDIEMIKREYSETLILVLAKYRMNNRKVYNFNFSLLGQNFFNKVINVFLEERMAYDKIFMALADKVYNLMLELLDNCYEDDEVELDDFTQYQFIESHKEMNKLAMANGYQFKSMNGDHAKYEHEITKKCVIIPQHNLGVGLSIKLQKQIDDNKEMMVVC